MVAIEDDGWDLALAVIAQMREAENRQMPVQECEYLSPSTETCNALLFRESPAMYTLQLQLLQQQYAQDSALRLAAYLQQQNVRR